MKRTIKATRATKERFWSKVDIRTTFDCWNWTASTHGSGYGQFQYEGRTVSAHRIAWMLTLGQGFIPEGMHVLHTCDNMLCVNPMHLFLGTHQNNINDAVRKRDTDVP